MAWREHPDVKFVLGLQCEDMAYSLEQRAQIRLIQDFVEVWSRIEARDSDKLTRDDWKLAGEKAVARAAAVRREIDPRVASGLVQWWNWLWGVKK
jgi:hypothetical protein